MQFISIEDFDVQAKDEVLRLFDATANYTVVEKAINMSIAQIKKYISGRYDVSAIFSAEADERDSFMIMIVIDLAMYHLWSKKAPRQIPEYRVKRYDDALDWIKDVGQGDIPSDLPAIADENYTGEIIIKSKYKPNDYKY